MPDKVRVGVIGTSWYADISHLARVKSHPRANWLRSAVATAAAPKRWRASMAFPWCSRIIGR